MALTELFTANQATANVATGGATAPMAGTVETWTVSASTGFGTAQTGVSQFHVVDVAQPTEVIAVTNVNGTTWTVTRGAEGTTPVAHTAGFAVRQVVTSGALTGFQYASSHAIDWINVVTQYGADPTGVADSTTALNNAAGAGRALYIPAGTYNVSAELEWVGDGLTIVGAGKISTVIVQNATNTPVAHVAGKRQLITGLTLSYPSQRPSSETRSIAFAMSSNSIFCSGSRYSDLSLLNAQTGIANHPDNANSAQGYSNQFDNISIIGYSQSAIAWNSPHNSSGNLFNDIYTENPQTTAASYPINLNLMDESAWNQLNVEGSILTTNAIQLTGVGSMTFNSVHCEGLTLNGDGTGIFGLPSGEHTQLALAAITVKGCTFAGAASNCLLAFAGWGTSVDLRGFFAKSNTVTTPAMYLASLGSTQNVSVTVAAADTSLFTALRTAGTVQDNVVNLATAGSGQYLRTPSQYAPATQVVLSTFSSTMASLNAAATTVAAGSNGGTISGIAAWSSPSAGVLAVASTAGWPTAGTINVAASGATTAVVTYTGVTSGTLTGCAYVSGSPSGTVATGGAVTLTAAGTGAAAVPAISTGSFTAPASGTVMVTVNLVAMIGSSGHYAFGLAATGTLSPLVANAVIFAENTIGEARLWTLKFLAGSLTPGTSYNFDLMFAAPAGSTQVQVLAGGTTSTTAGGTTLTPVTMEVQAI